MTYAVWCRTRVDKVLKGKGRVVNARFAVMCSHYLFDADFCNVASGSEKGVLEIEKSRTADGASGSMPKSSKLAPSQNSTPGWAHDGAPCAARSAIPSTRN